tara:strand:- start:3153 stop:3878 length:726 start_codon:yes stop_codon:yes gene_type:complete
MAYGLGGGQISGNPADKGQGHGSGLGASKGSETSQDADFTGPMIHERTVEERTKKEQKEAQQKTYQERRINRLTPFLHKKEEIEAQLEIENKVDFFERDWGRVRELNRELRAILDSDHYSKAKAMNSPALQWGGKILGMAVPGLSYGPTLENMAINAGFDDDTTPQDVIDADPTDNAPEGQTAEEQIDNVKDSVAGGFWGLLGFAKNNPKIFGPLSGEELWRLVMDEDAFWNYYEQGLVGG